ncbi:capsid protein [Pseudoalteromonas denitrificans]|uniref:Capsid protein n=1 Tax=Pseudoalteromonas denitrificans DSM 6059 TaxID=1123010 RepID=A0A1I1T8T5_9GAMM|nr:capsid protein [Pseudoalteromonas denitrificans]SFD55047.1 hypothetical protein SAMN02745724_04823 [Pseudoalteromonas denitrificans DSM 6059]
MSGGLPFTPSIEQTAIAIAYRNTRLIADTVCPRSPVGRMEFKYNVFDTKERFSVPDTRIGRKSAPNQIEFSVGNKTQSCEDFGLADVIPKVDEENAPANYNPRNHAVEAISDIILLSREVRVAKLYNKIDNFGTHQKLSGAEFKRLDDPDLDILPFFLEMLDTPLMRPNTFTMSSKVATAIRTNKKMIKAYNGSLGDEGLVPWSFIKETLELDTINVGMARINTAKKGEAMVLERAWKDSLAMTYVDPLASTTNNRMTFSLTAQYGERVSGSREVAAGLRGGIEVQVGESVCEVAIAKDCGLLLTDVIGFTAP